MLQVVKMNRNPLGRSASEEYLNQVLNRQSRKHQNFGDHLKKALAKGEKALDNVYFLLKGNEMIGCCGMVLNEGVHEEESQKPWITSLYVQEEHRGNNYSEMLLNHVIHNAKLEGYESAYFAAGGTDFEPRKCQNWVKLPHQNLADRVYYKNLDDRR